MEYILMNLQYFAEAGTLVNATTRYQNAYDASDYTSFTPGGDDLGPLNKTFYDTELLDNARDQLIFAQLGRKQALPKNHGRTVEWRKWNTLGRVGQLTEAVIPTGKKLGMTAITVSLAQYGDYVAISDLLITHAIDDAVLGATEELGAAAGLTNDELVRNVLMAGTNVIFCDAYSGSSYQSTPTSKATLLSALGSGYACDVTPDMINKAKTNLENNNVPTFEDGGYVAVMHPHVAYALRKHPDFQEVVKYQAAKRIFRGEIGELYGVRFVITTQAPIIKADSDAKATYKTMVFGKDAFGVIDMESGGLETIYKSRKEVGGPLEQFCTIGIKFVMAAKILYQERFVTLWGGSPYSGVDSAN